MCGICGYINSDREKITDADILRRMTQTLYHRGPDGEGYYRGPGVALGMRRLSIIDIEGGNQPIFNERKTLALICNGEIYNYKELRDTLIKKGHQFSSHSDVEVIVHLYEDHGVEALKYLRGMFALALWDGDKGELFLARDRLGIKPLHYAISDDASLYFGSEYKAILASGRVKKEADPHAIHDMFTYGFILSPKTMFKSIRRLLPGHYLIYRKGEVILRQYWDVSFCSDNDRPKYLAAEWADRVYEKLKESVRLHLRSDVPVCAWLSAGIDSSSIVAITRKILKQTVPTLSLIFDNQPDFDEIAGSKTLNQYPGFEIENQRIICKGQHFDQYPRALWFQEDPTTSGVPILQTMLAKATAEQYKVVLTGEGADEFLAGYPWYRFDMLFRPFSVLPRSLRSFMIMAPVLKHYKPWSSQVFLAPRAMNLQRYAQLIGLYEPDLFNSLFSPKIQEGFKTGYAQNPAFADFGRMKKWSQLEQLQYIEDKSRLTDLVTHNLDRISMSHSLELRVPFLDHEFVELTTKIPSTLKLHKQKEKYILREAMRDHLPAEIIKRKKRGLNAPVVNWLRDDLPEFALEMFSERMIKGKGYFSINKVNKILQQHRSGKADHTRPLMAILGIQMWDELFIQNRMEPLGAG